MLILLVIGLIIGGYAQKNAKTKLPIKFIIDGKDIIDCYEQDDEYIYVFLPSYTKLENVTVEVSEKNSIFCNGKALFDGDNIGNLEVDKIYDLTINNTAPKKFIILRSSNVATMFINTVTGSMDAVNADKDHKEYVDITLYDAEGKLNYCSTFTDKIRGRGNSTWGEDKKPYNLYLKAPAEILGMKTGDKWKMLANYYDSTNLRNKLILDYARAIQSYENFSPKSEFIDLYLNGEYNGLYLITEDIDEIDLNLGEYGFFFQSTTR